MAHMLDLLLEQLNRDRLQALAAHLGESTEKVYSASRSYYATFLGSILSKSNDLRLEGALKQSSNLYPNAGLVEDRIFSGNLSEAEKENAQQIINIVFAERTIVLQTRIASAEGISTDSSSELMLVLTAVSGAFTGNKMKSGNFGLHELASKIYDERAFINSSLPAGFSGLFGLGALTAVGGVPFHEGVILHYLDNNRKPSVEEVEKENKNRKWIGYLMLLIVLLLMAYFVKSCKTCNDSKGLVETIKAKADTPKQAATLVTRESVKVKLPGGLELNAYKGGIEEQVVEFLKSGALDKMSEEELKNKWFNFDNINYEFGSSDKITPESQVQLDNLVAILKEFKTVKIKLGAYTDKKGDDAANLKMSQGRADNMKKRLVAAGVGAQIAGAEGYGEQFATVDETKSDEERSIDRKISLRFVK